MSARSSPALDALRDKIARLETAHGRKHGVLPFGIAPIDDCLPGNGLAYGALHEVIGGGSGAVDGAAAALFVAGIAARSAGKVLWCVAQFDLFAPALEQVGLAPDRLIGVEAGDEKSVLMCVEEALRYGGLGVVVAEVSRLSMVASRRLLLAAEESGVMAIVLRRYRRIREAGDFATPTSAATRWRVSEINTQSLPVPGVAMPRWKVELLRARNHQTGDFIVEACDGKGSLALPANLANGQGAGEAGRYRATA